MERWESGNLSATKALNGSIEILIEASRIQKTCSHPQCRRIGTKNSASELKIV